MKRVVATVALMAVAAVASAQSGSASSALPERIGFATRDSLRALIDSARAAGLPTDPLVAKAAEGALKGADDPRILRAVRSLARELSEARQTLGRSASVASLTAAASALHAGASAAALRKVASAGSSEAAVTVSLVTLADLVASGVPSGPAAESIEQLVRRGAGEPELLAFRSAVSRDIGKGLPPDQALRAQSGAGARKP